MFIEVICKKSVLIFVIFYFTDVFLISDLNDVMFLITAVLISVIVIMSSFQNWEDDISETDVTDTVTDMFT